MKRKGFTLIELVVVIALIAILAVTLAPRLRDQIAKANDAKAIAVLGSMRTQSEIYYADFQEPVADLGGTGQATALDKLILSMDRSTQDLFDEGSDRFVPIGGRRATSADDKVVYGGEITFTFGEDGGTYDAASDDGIALWFTAATSPSGFSYDTKGQLWASY